MVSLCNRHLLRNEVEKKVNTRTDTKSVLWEKRSWDSTLLAIIEKRSECGDKVDKARG
jgi:hypothetical protein